MGQFAEFYFKMKSVGIIIEILFVVIFIIGVIGYLLYLKISSRNCARCKYLIRSEGRDDGAFYCDKGKRFKYYQARYLECDESGNPVKHITNCNLFEKKK